MSRADRGTITVEDARVSAHRAFPGEQFVLRLEAPACARSAQPGQFVHLRCDEDIPMRRPLSILAADPDGGYIEVLYKVVGEGLKALSRRRPGDVLSVLGPIGKGFSVATDRRIPVLLGGGVGIPPLLFFAERLAATGGTEPVALFGSELPFPFEQLTSERPLPGVSAEATASLTTLEQAGITGRLASAAGLPGCHRGYVTDLARAWLSTLAKPALQQCVVYACGPTPMLKAVQTLAKEFGLPSWLCLEEYMACAVGGCAGCAVPVQTPDGPAMKRVCVDGPVFDGYAVYP